MTNRPHMRRRKRKLRQVLHELREVIVPTEMHIPKVAEIPKPVFGLETLSPEEYAPSEVLVLRESEYQRVKDQIGPDTNYIVTPDKIPTSEPAKETSFKRRSW